MKITEILKKDSGKIILIAHVNKDTGELASIMDKAIRIENEQKILELNEELSKDDISDDRKIELELELEELKNADNLEPFEFELSQPTFNVIRTALSAIYSEGGELDTMSSGKIVFDACYEGNQGTLEEIQGFTTLYSSLCSKCYHSVVEIADIEYKKK